MSNAGNKKNKDMGKDNDRGGDRVKEKDRQAEGEEKTQSSGNVRREEEQGIDEWRLGEEMGEKNMVNEREKEER